MAQEIQKVGSISF